MKTQEQKTRRLMEHAQDPTLAHLDMAESLEEIVEQLEEIKNAPPKLIAVLKGDRGEDSNIPGPKGEKGQDGKDGRDGIDGKNGKDGRDGLDGINGRDGLDGKDGKDGKDGSPDTGEQIVAKINDLPTDDEELKIDAKHIKGLPDLKDSKGKTVFTAIRGPEVKIYDLSNQLDGVTKTFSLPAFRLVFDVRSSSFPYAFRPTTDYTTDGAGMTITFTDQITADATLAAGQTLYVLYLTI